MDKNQFRKYQIGRMPSFHIISQTEQTTEGQNARNHHPGLFHCEYLIDSPMESPCRTYLAVRDDQAARDQACISTVVPSEGMQPDLEQLVDLILWADEKGIELEGTIHSQPARLAADECLVEMYAPIKE